MLIDAGTAADAPVIVEALTEQGVDQLSFLVLSNATAEFVEGALRIADHIPIERVILSTFHSENVFLGEQLNALMAKGVKITFQSYSKLYRFGDLNFTIYPPLEKNYRNANNYSLCVLLQHGDVRMFFAGSAHKQRTEELLRFNFPNVTLYKIADHGHANNLTRDLLEVLQPEYSVVTGALADSDISKTIAGQGGCLLYTANGDLHFSSNRKLLKYLTDQQH